MISIRNLTYTYPFQNQAAVTSINLEVRAGEAVLLTGASGCGKSTITRLVNGLIPHYYQGNLEGEVRIKGEDTTTRSIRDLAQDIGTLFQDPESQFFAINVQDEIAMASEWRGLPAATIKDTLERVSAQFGIDTILDHSTLHLSEGQKQKVALAAISSLGPDILVLDEPSANLDPQSTDALAALLATYKEQGKAILIVDHRLYWLRDVVDRVLVIHEGKVVEQGAFGLLDDRGLQERYGLRRTDVTDTRETLPPLSPERDPLVAMRGVHFAYTHAAPIFQDMDLALPAGAIIGLIGPNGIGKTTFAQLITGLLKAESGEFWLRSRPTSPQKLLRSASIVLQNSDHQLHMQTVVQEIMTSAQAVRQITEAEARGLLEQYNLAHLADRHPQSLSGGEKQRLVIACGEAKTPDIFILDEPTSGLDGANMRIIARNARKNAERGACVLLISHDLELLQDICDMRLNFPLSSIPSKENP